LISNADKFIIYKSILVLILVFLISLGVAAYATYGERKVAAFMQDRIGPDRAGPFGILQPLADGLKMFMKEEIIPTVSNKFLFILGPSLAMLTALMAGVVIPWGGNISYRRSFLSFTNNRYQHWSIICFCCCFFWCIWYHDWRMGFQ
jgi:NADH:ubiquinone oxidoreductase subunit H